MLFWKKEKQDDSAEAEQGIQNEAAAPEALVSAEGAEPAAADNNTPEMEGAANTASMKKSLAALFFYWLIFFVSILYWEIFLGWLSLGSISKVNFWFLLFAVPQEIGRASCRERV